MPPSTSRPAASPAPLRVAFVGAGRNTEQRHLPGLRAQPGVELRSVCNRSPESSRRVAATWGIARVESDWRAAVAAPDIDAVCIGTWPDSHADIACAAHAAGKHVLCEARMAADLAGAERMAAAAAARPDLVAQLVPAPHTLAYDDDARAAIRSGRLGRVREVEVVHHHGEFLDTAAPLSWRLQSRFSGVNMLTFGIFYEVLLRWLEADARVLDAEGELRAATAARGADLPEALRLRGEFPALEGARLHIDLSAIQAGEPRLHVLVRGDAGELRWDGRANRLALRDASERETELAAARPDAWRVEADFVASIRAGATVRRTDFATGLRYMRFTAEARSALRLAPTAGA